MAEKKDLRMQARLVAVHAPSNPLEDFKDLAHPIRVFF
jgi:hypothetical protein